MPLYTFRNNKTGEQWTESMSIKNMEELTKEGSDISTIIYSPRIVSGVGSIQSKTDDGWKETLQKIQSGSGRSNTIRTK